MPLRQAVSALRGGANSEEPAPFPPHIVHTHKRSLHTHTDEHSLGPRTWLQERGEGRDTMSESPPSWEFAQRTQLVHSVIAGSSSSPPPRNRRCFRRLQPRLLPPPPAQQHQHSGGNGTTEHRKRGSRVPPEDDQGATAAGATRALAFLLCCPAEGMLQTVVFVRLSLVVALVMCMFVSVWVRT